MSIIFKHQSRESLLLNNASYFSQLIYFNGTVDFPYEKVCSIEAYAASQKPEGENHEAGVAEV